MSHRRKGRNVNGILLLDKAIGLTSNQALTEVKRLFDAKKAGHTGSLDPLACGMLPICFGEATKFSQFLLEADKQYLVEAKLGIRTTTGDGEGAILKTAPVTITTTELEAVLTSFRGEISQIPSMFSALKFQGKPLYTYARQGIEIARESRNVWIRALDLIDFTGDTFKIIVTCSKGTYIRTLIDDIGETIGCGAYVTFLRRTFVVPYHDQPMLNIDSLKELQGNNEALDSYLLPIDTALRHCPDVRLNSTIAYYIKQGQPVIIPHAPTSGYIRLFSEENDFLGVGQVLTDGRVAPRRLLAN